MSGISDELRNWFSIDHCGSGLLVSNSECDRLLALADRIDAETVELPKSADGKIWTGREVCFWTGATEGDRHEFNSLAYINGRWCVEDKHWQRYPAESVWYERPDSWETIADELEAWCVHAAGDCCIKLTDEDIVHDLAERIRKLADKEGDYGPF